MLIVDLESTCWEGSTLPTGEAQSIDNMEIIEIGCVRSDRAGSISDAKSFFVRPTENSELSSFCQSLTGINQSVTDQSPKFTDVIDLMDRWLGDIEKSFFWCSWGNYDLKHLLAEGSRRSKYSAILYYPHLNLRKLWRLTTKQRKKNSLRDAIAFHGLEFRGRQHSGLDDAINIARLLPFMDWSLFEEVLNDSTLR